MSDLFTKATAEIWDLACFLALDNLANAPWEPRTPLYGSSWKKTKEKEPNWWKFTQYVWLVPSGTDETLWIVATDGHSHCSFEVKGNCEEMIPIPKGSFPWAAKKAQSGGIELSKTSHQAYQVSHLSKGFTNLINRSVKGEIPIPGIEVTPQWKETLENMTTMPNSDHDLTTSAYDLGKAFTALGARLNHSLYNKAYVKLADGRGDLVAYSKEPNRRAVMRCAARKNA